MSKPRINWDAVPVRLVSLPTCPWCEHPKYDRKKTDANGDGGTTTKCVCLACGKPFKISRELPESGDSIIWPVYTSEP